MAVAKPNKIVRESMPMVVKNLATWLRECLYAEREDGGKFKRIIVKHLTKGNNIGQDVMSLEVPKKAGDEWSDNTAIDLYQRLYAEASVLTGMQRYAVYAYASTDMDTHTGRFLLKIMGEADEDEPLDSEGPDKIGLVSQAMRHSEAFAKINISQQMTIVGALQSMVTRQGSMIDRMLDQRMESLELIENLFTQKHERELDMKNAEAKAEALKKLGDKLGLFLPAVANRIAGKDLFPVTANAAMMTAKGLISSISADPSKMEKLMQILEPEQMAAFINLHEMVSKMGEDGSSPPDDKPPNGVS